MEDILIRRLLYTDNKELAYIHNIAFKDFFLTSLGVKFLETFYASILKHPNGFGVGLWQNGEIVGFGVGTSQHNGFYKNLIRSNGAYLLIAALLPIIKNPLKLYRIINNLFAKSDFEINKQTFTLLSICVNINKQSKGIGKKVLKSFEIECKKLGAKEVLLTTSRENNDNVNDFYKNNSYILQTSYKVNKQNREMNVYNKKI